MENKLKIKQILKHTTFQNVGYLTIGNILAQLVSLIGAFYIPRILGPEKYGTLNIIISYVALFTLFSFEGLNKVILRECSRSLSRTKQIFEGLLGLKVIFSISASLIAIMCLLFVDYDVVTKYYVIIFSISLVINPLLGTFYTIFQAHEEMKYIALFGVVQSIMSVSLSILAVSLGYGVLAILLIRLCTRLIMLASSYKILEKRFYKINFLSKINWDLNFLKQGFNFSVLNTLNTLSGKIDLVMLSFLTIPANVGIYALAYSIVQKGLILRGAVSTSLFPYYIKKLNKKQIKGQTLIKQTLIIALPSVILATLTPYFSPLLISIVGSDFSQSTTILNILIFYLVLDYITIPIGLALQGTNNEKSLLILGIVRAVLNIGLNLILFRVVGIVGIAYSTLITFSIWSVLLITTGYYKLKRQSIIY